MLKIFAVKEKMGHFYNDGKLVPYTDLILLQNKVLFQGVDFDKISTLKVKSLKKPQLKEFGEPYKIRTVRDDFLGKDRVEILLDNKESFKRVKVSGLTKGKGTQGVMRRWGFGGQDASHGTHKRHRSVGSLGPIKGRIWKGRKMAGRDGFNKRTINNLRVLSIDKDTVRVRGSIPGAKKGLLELIFN